ncbi:hypothetical protein VTL71DRAFT_536 [Oculimacula yallundae]|uniref:Uncharacterized protein n=1 Tax=Oculimacula yallundae TaxID=86028 RepID=A0ABR4D1U8_9HELO
MEDIPTTPDVVDMAAKEEKTRSDSMKHEYAILEKEIKNLELETLTTLLELSRQDYNQLLNENEAQIQFFQNQKWRLVLQIPLIALGLGTILIQLLAIWLYYHYPNGVECVGTSAVLDKRYFVLKLISMLSATAGTAGGMVISILRLGPILKETDHSSSREAELRKDKRRMILLGLSFIPIMALLVYDHGQSLPFIVNGDGMHVGLADFGKRKSQRHSMYIG